MSSLVFFLEEASAGNMLEAVVSRLAPPDVAVHYVTFEGKRDMERQLERKLRFRLEPDTCFIIMRDQDAEELKKSPGTVIKSWLAPELSGLVWICRVQTALTVLRFLLTEFRVRYGVYRLPYELKVNHEA